MQWPTRATKGSSRRSGDIFTVAANETITERSVGMSETTENPERSPTMDERRRYGTMTGTLGDIAYTLDSDGRFGAVTDTLVETTGYGREDCSASTSRPFWTTPTS